jgi:hypothetical protein
MATTAKVQTIIPIATQTIMVTTIIDLPIVAITPTTPTTEIIIIIVIRTML